MTRPAASRSRSAADPSADPFRERVPAPYRARFQLLGACFEFESNSRELMRLVGAAYAGLPKHALPGATVPLRVRVELSTGSSRRGGGPPPLEMFSGAGMLCGATANSTFATVSPADGAALVVVSRDMLASGYHTRYELIEFAVFTLAARVLNLAPLHAACVAVGERGALLLGSSGAGKSTLGLQCLLEGFDFISEDSVFVAPGSLRATGVANFLHVRSNSLRFVESAADISLIRGSPVIRRRSGVRKFEVDLRRFGYRLAPAPVRLEALVFLSARRASGAPLLEPMERSRALSLLAKTQPYAASGPAWAGLVRNTRRLAAFELRRGSHPVQRARALRTLLESSSR